MENCPEYERLHAQVGNVLGNLAQVATLLLELFRSRDLSGVQRLDKELELTVGEKERCSGALRQHVSTSVLPLGNEKCCFHSESGNA